MRLKSGRLFAVMVAMAAMLVPAAVASAGVPMGGGGGIDDHECEEDHYQSTNPQHVLYGRTQGTLVVDGKMQVDLSGMGFGVVAFWDEHFSTGSDGVVLVGTNFADVLCGTGGTDEIWGLMGNDRIFGMGAGDGDAPAINAVVGSGDRLYGNKGHDFITPGDGTGLGDMVDDYAAITGGGRGNDTIYAGDGGFHTLARGGMGNDEIFGGLGGSDDQILRGGDDDDVIHANSGDRTLAEGSAGEDVVNGGWGDYQVLNGNNGMDQINGGSGDYQRLFGGADDDELNAGSTFPQALFGGSGNDLLTGGETSYWGFGGSGDDMLFGGTDHDCLYGDLAASAAQEGLCQLFGLSGNWTGQPGGFGQVFPVGAATTGNDYIEGGDGYDSLFGGPGSDTIYANTPKLTNPNIGLDLADDSMDDLFGDDGNDTLFGNGSAGCFEQDFADGGANFAAGDSSWGLASGTNTINVENHSDEAACPVTP